MPRGPQSPLPRPQRSGAAEVVRLRQSHGDGSERTGARSAHTDHHPRVQQPERDATTASPRGIRYLVSRSLHLVHIHPRAPRPSRFRRRTPSAPAKMTTPGVQVWRNSYCAGRDIEDQAGFMASPRPICGKGKDCLQPNKNLKSEPSRGWKRALVCYRKLILHFTSDR